MVKFNQKLKCGHWTNIYSYHSETVKEESPIINPLTCEQLMSPDGKKIWEVRFTQSIYQSNLS